MLREAKSVFSTLKTVAIWIGLAKPNPQRDAATLERWRDVHRSVDEYIRTVLALDLPTLTARLPRMNDAYVDLLRESQADFNADDREYLWSIYAVACAMKTDHLNPRARKATKSPTLSGDDKHSLCRYWLIRQRDGGLLDVFERYISTANARRRRRSPLAQAIRDASPYAAFPLALAFAELLSGWFAVDNVRLRVKRALSDPKA